jgi:thiol-disulfide isomerase/thioredoxin/outer membrane lipoprotein-sorting protein
MNHLPRRIQRPLSPLLAGAGLLFLLAPAQAQENTETVAEILRTASKTYKAANSFSMDFDIAFQDGEETGNMKGTLLVSRPNKAKMQMKVTQSKPMSRVPLGKLGAYIQQQNKADIKELSFTIISDGTATYTITSPNYGAFSKQPAIEGENNIYKVMESADSPLGILVGFLRAEDPMEGAPKDVFKLSADATIEGKPANIITADIPGGPDPANKVVMKLALSKEDKLFREIGFNGQQDGKPSGFSMKFTNVKLNPELATNTFAFAAPAGAKIIEETATNADTTEETSMTNFDPRLKVGAAPLPFAGTDLNGKQITLAQFKGKVVLIDFWATWCGPCIAELPNVQKVYAKYKAKGFDIIGVSLDDSQAAVAKFVKEKQMPWTHIWDNPANEKGIAVSWKVEAIPFALLLGKDGKIAAVDLRGEALEKAVIAALQAK